MMERPVLYVSVERRFSLPGYEAETITIGVSQLPFDADETLINEALETGELAVAHIRKAIRDRIADIRKEPPAIDPSPFAPDLTPGQGLTLGPTADPKADQPAGGTTPPAAGPQILEPKVWTDKEIDEFDPFADGVPEGMIKAWSEAKAAQVNATLLTSRERREPRHTIDDYDPFAGTDPVVDERPICPICGKGRVIGPEEAPECSSPECRAFELGKKMAATQQASRPIPTAEEVRTHGQPFGVDIAMPPAPWHSEPLTEVGGEGDGGQMKKLNTVLGVSGYSKGLRHPATLAILQAFGPIEEAPARTTLSSLKELSKAEAHIAISFLEAATPEQLTALTEKIKEGQPCLLTA